MGQETEVAAAAAALGRRRSSFWVVHDWPWLLGSLSAVALAGAFFLFLFWAGRQPAVGALAVLPENTLIEFGDFNCSYCAYFAVEVLPRLRTEYIAPGRMAYEYRHFPVGDFDSWEAAWAAECAREQGAFAAYRDQVLGSLVRGGSEPWAAEPDFKSVGLGLVKYPQVYQECIYASRTGSRVRSDYDLGQELRVSGTPALFLNGQELDSRLLGDYAALARELDRLLEPVVEVSPAAVRPAGG